MHHPLEWLATEICGQAVRNLTTDFDLVLTGHVHSPLDLRFITAPRGECLFAPCPVLYDRPYSDSIEFARGIAVGELDTGTSEMRLYYYRYSAGSGGRLLPYSDVYPSGTDCFSVTLGHLPESLASDRPTFLEAVGALQASDAADPTERTVNEDAHGQRVQRLFDRTLVLQDAISPIPLLGPVQASAAAYRVVCRALLSLRTQQAFPDLADVDPLFVLSKLLTLRPSSRSTLTSN